MLPNPSYCKNSPKSQPLTVLGFSKITTKAYPQQCSPLASQTYWRTAPENTLCTAILRGLVPTLGISSGLLSPLKCLECLSSSHLLLLVRNGEKGCPTKLEIVDQSHVAKDIHVGQSMHGPLYTDEWFHGISWNQEETLIAYIAEAPPQPRPVFSDSGYRKGDSSDEDCNTWKGQGDWEEDWGERYSKKGRPSLFVLDIASGEVRAAEGIATSLSVGQVVWVPPSSSGSQKYLVFVGWSEHNGFHNTARKLGIKYCSNRPCALYAIASPFERPETNNKPVW